MKIKRIEFLWIVLILSFICVPIGAQTQSSSTNEDNKKNEVKSELEQRRETLQYGLDGEVISLIDTLITEKDTTFSVELSEIFKTVRNTSLRDKILSYFTLFEDSALKDYAIYLLEDPYDEKNSTVVAVMAYVEKLKILEAAPLLQDIIQSENEAYFNAAVSAIGKVGGSEEALFLVEYFENDLPIAQKQIVVRALGALKAVETYDELVEMAKNEDENTFVRMYATEAIGNIKPEESIDTLMELYSSTDPNLRQYVIKGLATNITEKAQNLLLTALKDDHYKVRLEAIAAIQSQKMSVAGPAILYRAQNDVERVVKNACYEALAALNYIEGIEFLISLIEDEKVNDTIKVTISDVLLKHDIKKGVDAVIKLAYKTLADDKKKNLRYALGKKFSSYESNYLQDICAAYLKHSDISTKGTGLDIYKKNPYVPLQTTIQAMADGEESPVIKAKAKSILEG